MPTLIPAVTPLPLDLGRAAVAQLRTGSRRYARVGGVQIDRIPRYRVRNPLTLAAQRNGVVCRAGDGETSAVRKPSRSRACL
jgi:hypothetical protein